MSSRSVEAERIAAFTAGKHSRTAVSEAAPAMPGMRRSNRARRVRRLGQRRERLVEEARLHHLREAEAADQQGGHGHAEELVVRHDGPGPPSDGGGGSGMSGLVIGVSVSWDETSGAGRHRPLRRIARNIPREMPHHPARTGCFRQGHRDTGEFRSDGTATSPPVRAFAVRTLATQTFAVKRAAQPGKPATSPAPARSPRTKAAVERPSARRPLGAVTVTAESAVGDRPVAGSKM